MDEPDVRKLEALPASLIDEWSAYHQLKEQRRKQQQIQEGK